MNDFVLMDEMVGMSKHPGERFKDYSYTKKDKEILRQLAEKKAEIASQPIHKEKIKMWKLLNDLKEVKPMIWINEIPWNEMDTSDELILKTSNEFTKALETKLRKTLYRWKYLPADMVIEPSMQCYPEIENTGFGISELAKIARTNKSSNVISREFTPQIENEKDIEKIKMPRIIYKEDETEKKFQVMQDIFKDILKVEKVGYPGFWFSPWDELTMWWNVEKLLLDLVLRPRLIHKTMERLTKAYLRQLDEYESNNLLSLNNGNFRIGSGGLGYTEQLPGCDFNPSKIKAKNLWGSGAAQIFSAVSPEMHVEFALNYEIQWMKRFGLVYYGCCEPLDKKINILRAIPNLRKISMSPWVDLELGAASIGRDYVFSYKPNPSIFAEDSWDYGAIRKKLSQDLKKIKGCNVEIIMKDISTVRYKPQRLWEWAKIASEVVNELFL